MTTRVMTVSLGLKERKEYPIVPGNNIYKKLGIKP
jgi:hypothetical protein